MTTGSGPAAKPRRFIDLHSHMVPSGDDGVGSLEEALDLCRAAASRGTSVLYATPHVNRELPLTAERDAYVRENASALNQRLHADGLEVRIGYELHPAVRVDGDERRYRLDGFDAVLVECPLERGRGNGVEAIFRTAEALEAAGLLPVLAHPERSPAVLAEPEAATAAARRGWMLQVTAASLLGRYGEAVTRLAWSLLDGREALIVASDGHRPDRPPFLDGVLPLLSERFGPARALELLDGSALARVKATPDGR